MNECEQEITSTVVTAALKRRAQEVPGIEGEGKFVYAYAFGMAVAIIEQLAERGPQSPDGGLDRERVAAIIGITDEDWKAAE